MSDASFARRGVLAFVAAVILLVGVVLACTGRSGGRDEGTPPVDTPIMAFLSEARALHHEADVKEDANDLDGAIRAMDRLVGAPRPHPERSVPEIDEVLADGYARLAELELKKGDLDQAGRAIQKGLERAPTPTYFRGHLFEVQGLVEEARAAQLADAGNALEAAKARERAIELLEEVVRIQDQVIQRSLAGKDGGS